MAIYKNIYILGGMFHPVVKHAGSDRVAELSAYQLTEERLQIHKDACETHVHLIIDEMSVRSSHVNATTSKIVSIEEAERLLKLLDRAFYFYEPEWL